MDHILQDQELARQALERLLGARSALDISHLKAPDFLIPDLIQRQAITIVSAAPGTGKTWLGLQLGVCGAAGIPVMEKFNVPKTYPSLYCALDSPSWDIGGQIRKIYKWHGLIPGKELNAMQIIPNGFSIHNAAHLGVLSNYWREFGVRLLVIDVLAASHSLDENNNMDMSRLFNIIKELRDKMGMAIVILHHTRKMQQGALLDYGNDAARGAGAIIGSAEQHLALTKTKSGIVKLNRLKLRGEGEWNALDLVFEARNEAVNLVVAQESIPPEKEITESDNLLLSLLCAGPRTRKDLLMQTKMLGYSEEWMDSHLHRLKKSGQITSPTRGVWQVN